MFDSDVGSSPCRSFDSSLFRMDVTLEYRSCSWQVQFHSSSPSSCRRSVPVTIGLAIRSVRCSRNRSSDVHIDESFPKFCSRLSYLDNVRTEFSARTEPSRYSLVGLDHLHALCSDLRHAEMPRQVHSALRNGESQSRSSDQQRTGRRFDDLESVLVDSWLLVELLHCRSSDCREER